MKMKKISTEKAPKAIGPYSQAVKAGNLVFCAAQIAMHPETNELIEADIEKQTKQVIENLKNVLEAAGSSLDNAIKVNVYLKDINDFQKMNKIYEKFFASKPARTTIQAAGLPKDALILIDVISELK